MSGIPTQESATEATDPRARRMGPVERLLHTSGEMLDFAWQAVRQMPAALRNDAVEVMRQAGIMVSSHLVVVLFLAAMMGAMLGVLGSFVFESIGLDSYVAIIIAIPQVRGVLAIVFGWVFAAKAGCGMVAELGAMRISEEVDALEVMCVRSVPYLVGTRLLASLIVVPAMYVTALLTHFFVAQLFFVNFLGTASSGGFEQVLYSLQSPRDLIFTVTAGTVVGFVVTLIACYYGYTASGGPVGVGRNTAKSMLTNLVCTGLLVMILVQAVYGGELTAPVGN